MIQPTLRPTTRGKAVWGSKRILLPLLLCVLATASPALAAPGKTAARASKPGKPGSFAQAYKMDAELTRRAKGSRPATEHTRVIVELVKGATVPPEFRPLFKRSLNLIHSAVLDVPNSQLAKLAAHPAVFRLHHDRPAHSHNYRTTVTTGARAAQSWFGLTGAGVGVAVIDSGVTSWHDDLTGTNGSAAFPYGDQRVAAFVDFVNGQTAPYDDFGHGTHVAGIIAGNGTDSNGVMAGVAPQASLVSLKVLDGNGDGTISNMIAALDWVAANQAQYNLRVVNMSVGANIYESYWTDPLTLAAQALVNQGIVVVAAAGNMGVDANGNTQYGSITAPGNAPWVLTVGASSTQGTLTRTDDTVATFSSRGPTFLDWGAKPDLVAPGVGTVSLSDPGGYFYAAMPQYLVPGSAGATPTPYLVLTGTSMAAPVVTGTVALMLQANPSLTPNAVKAILEYTAQAYPGYDPLTEGAGFLNTLGATRLAVFFATGQPGETVPTQQMWSKHLLWGNQLLAGGVLQPDANAWGTNVVWGAAATSDTGANIVWGSDCGDPSCDNIVWGSSTGGNIVWGSSVDGSGNIVWGSDCGVGCDNIVWGSSAGAFNIVWGSDCGGSDCDNIVWGSSDPADNIVWGASSGVNIVWGSDYASNIVWGSDFGAGNIVWGSDFDPGNIVWGSDDAGNIVWGLDDSSNIVWGSSAGDNVVWGSDFGGGNIVWGSDTGNNVVWGSDYGDNIVWGSDVGGGNIVWGSDTGDNIVWGSSGGGNIVWGSSVGGTIVWGDPSQLSQIWTQILGVMPLDEQLLGLAPVPGS